MAELVDVLESESSGEICKGSSPSTCTKYEQVEPLHNHNDYKREH